MPEEVVILGLGFTGSRLAWRLLSRGVVVYAAVRDASRFQRLASAGLKLAGFCAGDLPRHAVVVHSIPPLDEQGTRELHALIAEISPRRIVYISSTGIYGDQNQISAATLPAPNEEKGRRRLEEETWIAEGPWSKAVLRSAAIYGPGRGVHVRVREGKRPRGEGIVSRIHVDDLAALLEAAALSDIEGAWPVADDHPSTTGEISQWCADLQGIRLPGPDSPDYPVKGRSVNGETIRDLLSIRLKYSSYRDGIPACIAEETTPPPEPR